MLRFYMRLTQTLVAAETFRVLMGETKTHRLQGFTSLHFSHLPQPSLFPALTLNDDPEKDVPEIDEH